MTLGLMTTTAVAHHIALRREVFAARADVWRSFTDADSLSAWFGPRGFHVPSLSVTVTPVVGGSLRLTMVHNQDRQLRTDVDAQFVEVVAGEKVVLEEDLHDGHAPMTLVVTLSDLPASGHGDGLTPRTEVVLEQGPYPEHLLAPAAAGWESSLDKLDAHLAGLPVEPLEAF